MSSQSKRLTATRHAGFRWAHAPQQMDISDTAHIRSIHPDFFADDAMNLSVTGRFQVGILTECDEQVIFQGFPKTLQARILPADNVDVETLLSEVVDRSNVRRCELGGVQVSAVCNYTHYQRPKKTNSSFFITAEVRTYVALDVPSGEPESDKYDTAADAGDDTGCMRALLKINHWRVARACYFQRASGT